MDSEGSGTLTVFHEATRGRGFLGLGPVRAFRNGDLVCSSCDITKCHGTGGLETKRFRRAGV